MPPLCTAGYGLGTGHWSYFVGAFYLFIINCVFISIATFIMVRFLKFKFINYANEMAGTRTRIQKWVGFIALLTLLPSIYMAYRLVQEEIFKQKIQTFITNEIRTKNIIVINQQIETLKQKATLYVMGTQLNDSTINLIVNKKADYNLSKASIEIINSSGNKQENINVDELKTGIIEDLFKKQQDELKTKTIQLQQLETQATNRQVELQREKKVIEEFKALFGELEEVSLSTTLLYTKNSSSDSIAILYIKPLRKSEHIDAAKAEKWLRVRLHVGQAKVCIQK